MALSNQVRRAIAIRSSIQRRQAAQTAARPHANDNKPSPRIRGGARIMSTGCLQACIDAAGFDQHAAY